MQEQQTAMYVRARALMEKLIPELRGADDHDALLALQLLLAKHGRAAGYKPEGLVRVLDVNLPEMFKVWEQADPAEEGGLLMRGAGLPNKTRSEN